MAEYLIQGETLTEIANAIRENTGQAGMIAVGDMAQQISAMVSNSNLQSKTVTVVENNTIYPDEGYDGLSKVEVQIPVVEGAAIAVDFSVGDQTVTAPSGYLVKSAILQKPETLVPENIAKGVTIAGIEGTHEGSSGENLTVLAAETTLEGFAYTEMWGAYCYDGGTVPFELKLGEIYIVKWDGESYTCVAQDTSAVAEGSVAIGDLSAFGGIGNGEPFAIAYLNGSLVLRADPEDTSTSHTVGIYQKTSGGAAVEGAVYVTFMSEDGTTELYKKPVFIGDDCMEPVTRGWLDVPTKDATNTDVFAYSGWSLTSGGAADDSALLNVTEDRTVYAAFTASTRYYTVRFFDEETLLKTMQVAYGGTADYTPEKTGYTFDGWTPSNTNIVADTDCYAAWTEFKVDFATGTWAEIARVCEKGTAAAHFAVGETKTLTTTDGKEWTITIIGLNLDAVASDALGNTITGTAGITATITPVEHYCAIGYINTYFNDLKATLPEELTAVMKRVRKYNLWISSSTGEQLGQTASTMFVPSLIECGLGSTMNHSQSSIEHTYPGLNTASKRIICKRSDGSAVRWWVRNSGNKGTYYSVSTDGSLGTESVTSNRYALPCICI